MELERKQWIGIAKIAAVILGLVAVPPLLQKFYGIDAIKTAFVVIVFYAILNWWMKNRK